MMDKQTSDERLLKLIEGSGELKSKPDIIAGLRKTQARFISGKFNFPWLKSKFKHLKVSLLYLNKGLIGLAALSTLILLYTIFSAPTVPQSNAAFFSRADASAIIKLISGGLVRKNVLSQDLKRDFFLPFDLTSSSSAPEEAPESTQELKSLKLVGIIWSKNPEVMIENSKDSRTYTLKKGESLDEQFKVKEISRSSATLEVATQAGVKEYVLR